MGSLSSIFEDRETTNFVVVSIPTHLAVAESKRLLHALDQAQMPVRHVIINQCSFLGADGRLENLDEAKAAVAKMSDGYLGRTLGISDAEATSLRHLMERLLRQRAHARQQVATLEAEVSSEVQVFR